MNSLVVKKIIKSQYQNQYSQSKKGYQKKRQFSKLETDDVIELLTECLNNTYFQYNQELFIQNDGCPMGSPISGTVADIFLQKLEKNILPLNPKIIFWKPYVDDVFAIIEGDAIMRMKF